MCLLLYFCANSKACFVVCISFKLILFQWNGSHFEKLCLSAQFACAMFVLSRLCLTELKQRPICPYVKWANTCEALFACAHCERLSSMKLTIDYCHDFAYWHYIHAPSEFRRLVRETVRELYADLFEVLD